MKSDGLNYCCDGGSYFPSDQNRRKPISTGWIEPIFSPSHEYIFLFVFWLCSDRTHKYKIMVVLWLPRIWPCAEVKYERVTPDNEMAAVRTCPGASIKKMIDVQRYDKSKTICNYTFVKIVISIVNYNNNNN